MRIERDALGEMQIPDDVYYGLGSFRGHHNFQISHTQVHPILIRAYLLLKRAAAVANNKVMAMEDWKSQAIVAAVDELLKTDYRKHFIIDAFQAGAGTSQNMNANEVIANKANLMLGGKLGEYEFIHPNDDVNMSQSTNDTYPTVMQLSILQLSRDLTQELDLLGQVFGQKGKEFALIFKAGRTHLQDAVPIKLGQEFSAYQATIMELHELIRKGEGYLRVLGIGGSAVGTGTNVPKGFGEAILLQLKELFGDSDLDLAKNKVASMQSQLPVLIYSNALRASALQLTRILNDLRLMSSGPNNGLSEIILPAVQPGSSMMPGKLNPSILEMGHQVLFKILGNDHAMAFASQAGQLELNVMMPLMAQVTLESIHLLTQALKTIRERCINDLKANKEQCEKYAGQTTQTIVSLIPILGYSRAGEIVKEALQLEKSVLEYIRENKILNEDEWKDFLLSMNIN